ncbi:MAG: chromate transporter [Clostridium sp.]|nr:chromate transporter [Clostridium sp.]
MVLLELFWSFLKIGAFSFGGGYAMLPLIQKEIIEVHGWMTSIEFIDILAVVEMTPGPIAINSATFLGYRVAGVLGSTVATLGVILPSIIIILIIAHFLSKFKDLKVVDYAFKGLRPVVLGLLISAGFAVSKGSIIDIKSFLLGLVFFVLVVFRKIHPIIIIIGAGILGLILY